MPTRTIAAEFNETAIAGLSTGVSLSTAAVFTSLVPNTQWISLTPRNLTTAVVVRYNLCPYAVILKNQDALVTEPINGSFLLQDGENSVTMDMSSFDTLANGDALYIGSYMPFGGLHVDIQNANSNASTIAVSYYNGTLTTLSVTDNTISSGHSFGQDGTITWTTPTDWVAATFATAFGSDIGGNKRNYYTDPIFWLRLSWSAAFDSSTSVNQIRAINRRSTLSSPVYTELASGQAMEQTILNTYGGVSAIEALTDAGTASLIHLCATLKRGKFLPVAAVGL